MFHLAHNAFLKLETDPYTSQFRAVISSGGVFPMEASMEAAYPERVILSSTDVNDVYPDRFVALLTEAIDPKYVKGFTIYCCPHAYRTLVAAWFKAMFPGLTLDLFKFLFKMQAIKDEYCPIDHDSRGSVNVAVESTTEDMVEDLYDSVQPSPELSKFIASVFPNTSLEYQIVDYLRSGRWRPIANTVAPMANKALRTLLNRTKHVLATHCCQHPEELRESMTILPTGWDIDLPRVGPIIAGNRFKTKTTFTLNLQDKDKEAFINDCGYWFGEVLGYREGVVNQYISLIPLARWFGEETTEDDIKAFLNYLAVPFASTTYFNSSTRSLINVTLIHHLLNMPVEEIRSIPFIRP